MSGKVRSMYKMYLTIYRISINYSIITGFENNIVGMAAAAATAPAVATYLFF